MREPYVDDGDFKLFVGDALEVLQGLPAESVHCVATSPPFYALRDYGVEGQIGLEATPEEWVARLVGVFREVRRVLRPDGTLWVECGDSYASVGGKCAYGSFDGGVGLASAPTRFRPGNPDKNGGVSNRDGITVRGLKAKDLLGTPWLLAFALRADGWWLRQAIIWHKPNAMPESVADRCTTAHSYVFLLSKSARYYFDAEAIAEPAEWARWGAQTVPKYEGTATASGWMKPQSKDSLRAKSRPSGDQHRGVNGEKGRPLPGAWMEENGRKNARSVWTIPTQSYPEAHFATWPEALVERIIKAGCPEGGTVIDCFAGSGTTALVARRLGRKSIGIELNPAYAELAARRLNQLSLLAEETA